MPDLSEAVTGVLQQRFDWWAQKDSLDLMLDLASAGVSTSMSDYVDTTEHGIVVQYAHSDNCEECSAMMRLLLSSAGKRDG